MNKTQLSLPEGKTSYTLSEKKANNNKHPVTTKKGERLTLLTLIVLIVLIVFLMVTTPLPSPRARYWPSFVQEQQFTRAGTFTIDL